MEVYLKPVGVNFLFMNLSNTMLIKEQETTLHTYKALQLTEEMKKMFY